MHVSSISLELSSNDLKWMTDSSEKTSNLSVFISLINLISGIKSLNDYDKETYSASVEDSATTICSL